MNRSRWLGAAVVALTVVGAAIAYVAPSEGNAPLPRAGVQASSSRRAPPVVGPPPQRKRPGARPSTFRGASSSLKFEAPSPAFALPPPETGNVVTSSLSAGERPTFFDGDFFLRKGDSAPIRFFLTDFLGRVQANTAYEATYTQSGVTTQLSGTSDGDGYVHFTVNGGVIGPGSFVAFTQAGTPPNGGNGQQWTVFEVVGVTSFEVAYFRIDSPFIPILIPFSQPFPVDNIGGGVSLVTNPSGVPIPTYYGVNWTVERDGAFKPLAEFLSTSRNGVAVRITSPGVHRFKAQGSATDGVEFVSGSQDYRGRVLLDEAPHCVVGNEEVVLTATVTDAGEGYSWTDQPVFWANVVLPEGFQIDEPRGTFTGQPGRVVTFRPTTPPASTMVDVAVAACSFDLTGQQTLSDRPYSSAARDMEVVAIPGLASFSEIDHIEVTPSSATVESGSSTNFEVRGVRATGTSVVVPAGWTYTQSRADGALYLGGTETPVGDQLTSAVTYRAPSIGPAVATLTATLCDKQATAAVMVRGAGVALTKPGRPGNGNQQEPKITHRGMACGDDQAPAADTQKEAGRGAPGNVYLHNGEEHMTAVDLFVKGRGQIDFVMSREYRSRVVYNGSIGSGWAFGYGEHLFLEPNGDVTHVDGFGRADLYTRISGSADFASPREFFTRLRLEGDGVYTLRDRHGFKRHFDLDGRLIAHEDRNGNRMSFTYDESGRLAYAYDPYERPYAFSWTDAGLLASVSDFSGRTVVYTHDANRDLVAVTTPPVTGTSTANDFPDGRTTRYTYSSGFADESLNHNLLSVTLPVEVANSGPAYLSITYGNDANDPFTYDRVVSIVKGGTNLSGVAAGGTFNFSYSPVVAEDSLPPGSVTKGVMVDPAGNTLLEAIDDRGRLRLSRKFVRGLRPNEPVDYFCGVYEYNDDSLITKFTHRPQNNYVQYTYDAGNPNPLSRCNLLEVRQVPDAARGGGEPIVTRYTYEPLFNQVTSITDPRELSPTFVPTLGANAPGRYTTKFFYDYQETLDPVSEADDWQIDLSAVSRGLGDLNDDGRTDQMHGNCVKVSAPTVNLLPSSNLATATGSMTQSVITQTEFNDAGQPVRMVDPEGNVTRIYYTADNDPDGDGVVIPWNASPSFQGYVQSIFVDVETSPRRTTQAPPISASTFYSYDPVGHITFTLNPRGVWTYFEWSAADEVISVWRAVDTFWARQRGQLLLENQDFSYRARSFHDANGRVVRTEVENRDGNAPELGPWIEATVDYDILGEAVKTTRRVGAQQTITTEFRYTPHERLELVIKPEGNQVKYEWDERDLLLRVTRGFGATTTQPSVVTYNYDNNKNLIEVLDAQHVGVDGQPTKTTFTYDGFDRVKVVTDALGGKAESLYDPASQLTTKKVFGHPAGHPQDPVVLLGEQRLSHDELGRVFQVDVPLFLAAGFANARPFEPHEGALTPGDGLITARTEFDALSRAVYVVDDDLQTSRTVFDGASRPISRVDACGNLVEIDYDLHANPMRVRRTEVSPEGRVPNQVFTTHYVWDSLDRLARVTDNVGQTARMTYDSRSNLIESADAVGPLVNDPLNLYVSGQINSTGNTTRFFHDGMSRVLRKVIDLRVSGQGGNALDTSNPASAQGTITHSYQWDKNSRLAGVFDDKNNATVYQFDELDRAVKEIAADLTFRTTSYDRNSNAISSTDANGTVVTRTYDVLNRVTAVNVTPSATWHVRGTTAQTFEYDGASRSTRAVETTDGVTSQVSWVYDSLSRVLEEVQDAQVVSHVWSGDGRRLACTYSGGTRLDYTHDANKRLKSISQSATQIAGWEWIGPGLRPLQRTAQNGVTLSFLNDTQTADIGWDAAQRVARMRYLAPNGAALVDLSYGYDRANNRTFETRNHEGRSDTFAYDSAYRLTQAQYNVDPNAVPGALPDGVLNVSLEKFTLDGVNNRVALKQTLDTLNAAGTALKKKNVNYTTNSTNEYTQVGSDGRAYDPAGNILEDEKFFYRYDFRNLLVELRNKVSGKLRKYRYDALGRRIEKTWGPTTPDPEDPADDAGDDEFTGDVGIQHFVHDGWRVVEQKRANGTVAIEWVFGVGIDEPIKMSRRRSNGSVRDTYFYCQNAIGSVVALTDAAGSVVERYKYLAFGREEIYDASGVKRSGSAVGNPIRFQGRWRDSAEGSPLVYFRARYYDPKDGRFTSRDPIGVWGDPGQLGNGYGAFGNNGINRVDPFGEDDLIELRERRRQSDPDVVYVGGPERRITGYLGDPNAINQRQAAEAPVYERIRDIRADINTLKQSLPGSGQIAQRETQIADLRANMAAGGPYYALAVDYSNLQKQRFAFDAVNMYQTPGLFPPGEAMLGISEGGAVPFSPFPNRADRQSHLEEYIANAQAKIAAGRQKPCVDMKMNFTRPSGPRPTNEQVKGLMTMNELFEFGPPAEWTPLGETPGSGTSTYTTKSTPGSTKVYEGFLDADRKYFEVHYDRNPNGSVSNIKIKRK